MEDTIESIVDTTLEESFDGWKAAHALENMSLRDIYECGFRHGAEAALQAQSNDELRAHRQWPVMGYGRVAVGGGLQPDGTSALLYLDMGETRPINTDTSDLFPPGEAADPQKLLACVYFRDWGAIQQTIDVLKEMQEGLT